MYNNPYMNYTNNFNQQSLNDRIDNQIAQLNQMKEQIKTNTQQPQTQPSINQTFQLAPNNHTMRYANTIDEVNKEIVYFDTPFFSKDMSILWVKNAKGDIKTYELTEILPIDEKDMQIKYLQSQIEELKGMIKNDANVTNDDAKQITTNTTGDDNSNGEKFESNKSTSVQKVSRSKKEQ